MAGSFQGHIIGPFDAHVIVILEDGGDVDVGKSVACVGDTAISREYLGLTGAKGHEFLTFTEPANRAFVFEDDATIHAPELEQGEESAISN